MATPVMPANCKTSAAAWAPVMRRVGATAFPWRQACCLRHWAHSASTRPGASHTKSSGLRLNILVTSFLIDTTQWLSNFDATDIRRPRREAWEDRAAAQDDRGGEKKYCAFR